MHSASLSIIEFEEGIGKVKQFADISHFQYQKRPQNGLFGWYKN